MLDALQFSQELMRCPSVTPVDHGALDVLEGALKPLGFKCTRLPFSEPGEPTVDNLYARLGTGKPFLCFAGHTDVVPPGDEKAWSVPPFSATVKDGMLIGRGAVDMKVAIACWAAAVAQFLKSHTLKGSIGFIITGDEEGYAINGTRKMVHWMREHKEIPDACVVGEPTNPENIGDMVKIGRRGSMNMILTVKGKQGHVAYPQLADNPVTKLVNILYELQSHTIDTGTEFFPPTNLEVTSVDVGNMVKNIIPAQANAHINIRFNDLHTARSLTEWVQKVANKYADGASIDMHSRCGAFLTHPGEFSKVVAEAVEAVTGRAPALTTVGGASDAVFIKELCPVVEFGAINETAHKVDECIRLPDIELLTNCYLEMLKRYFS